MGILLRDGRDGKVTSPFARKGAMGHFQGQMVSWSEFILG